MADKKFSRTIEINGTADFSKIISSINKLRSEVEGKATNIEILNIDKSIEKIKDLQAKIKQAQEKGFSSPKELQDFNKMINTLLASASTLSTKFESINLKGLDQDINEAKKKLKEANTEVKKIEKQIEEAAKAGLKNVENSKEYAEQIKENASNLKEIQKIQKNINQGIEDQIANRKIELEQAQQLTKNLQSQLNESRQQRTNSAFARDNSWQKRLQHTDGSIVSDTEFEQIRQNYRKCVIEANTAEAAQREFNKALKEMGVEVKSQWSGTLKNIFKSIYPEDTNLKELKKQLAEANKTVEILQQNINDLTTKRKTASEFFSSETFTKLLDQLEAGKIKAADLRKEVNNAMAAAENPKPSQSVEELNKDIKEGTESWEEQKKAIQGVVDTQIKLDSLSDFLSNGVKRVLSLTTAWQGFRRAISTTYNDIKELDKAFGSIAMVTEYTVGDLWEQYGTYAEMANKLGQTTQGVIEASSLYYQQGLDTAEVMSLTEETMKLATLAGQDFKEATSQMTAALRAFKLEMTDGAHVTDVYAELAAHAAASVDDISQAMSATAAIAHSAGMEFETTSAMLTTMIEATQEAPKNLGTALKAVIARFTELKNDVSGTPESEFDDLDYNKVDKALKSVGVSLKDANGQFRDLDDVFLELSQKWNTLDRNSQRYVATIAAGSRQQSRFIALMENYQRTVDLIGVAQNSAGKSSQQFAKYQDTLEYKVKQLKNSWEQLRTSFLQSDMFKNAVSGIGSVVDKINSLSGGQIAAIGATWLTLGRTMASNFISGFQSAGNYLSGVLGSSNRWFNKAENSKGFLNSDTAAEKILNGAEKIGADQLDKSQLSAKISQARGKVIGQALATGITMGVTNGITANNPGEAAGKTLAMGLISFLPAVVSAATSVASAAGVAITGTFISATAGIGAIIVGAFAGVSAAINSIIKLNAKKEFESIDNQINELDKSITDLNEDIGETSNKLKDIKNARENLEDIAETYDKLAGKSYLTAEEQEKYKSMVDALKEEYPELITYYNEETNQITIQNSLLEDKIQKLKEEQAEQSKILVSQKNLSTAYTEQKNILSKQKSITDKLNLSYDDTDSFIKKNGNRLLTNANSQVRQTVDGKTIIKNENERISLDNESLLGIYKAYIDTNTDINKLDDHQIDQVNQFLQEVISGSGEYIDIWHSLNDEQKKAAQELRNFLVESNKEMDQLSNSFVSYYQNWLEFYKNTNPDASDAENTAKAIAASISSDTLDKFNYTTAQISALNLTSSASKFDNDELQKQIDQIKTAAGDTIKVINENLLNPEYISKVLDSITEGLNTQDEYSQFLADLTPEAKEVATLMGLDKIDFYKEFTEEGGLSEDDVALQLLETYFNNLTQLIAEKGAEAIEFSDEEITALSSLISEQDSLTLDEFNEKLNIFENKLSEAGRDSVIVHEALSKLFNTDEIASVDLQLKRIIGDWDALDKLSIQERGAIYKALTQDLDLFPGKLQEVGKEAINNYFNYIEDSDLSDKMKKALWEYDLKSISNENKEIVIDTFTKLAVELDEQGELSAKNWAEGFVDFLQGQHLIKDAITNAISLEQIVEQEEEKVKNALTGFGKIKDIIKNQFEKGYISATDKGSLKKAIEKINEDLNLGLNANDFLGTDAMGNYVLETQRLLDIFEELLGDGEKLAEQAKAAAEYGQQRNEAYQAMLEAYKQTANQPEAFETSLTWIKNRYGEDIYNEALQNYETFIKGQEENNKAAWNNYTERIKIVQKEIDSVKDQATELQKKINDPQFWEQFKQGGIAALKEIGLELDEIIKKVRETYEKAKESYDKNQKSIDEQKNTILDAQKAVTDAQKALNETLYGTQFFKGNLDPMYNYNTILEDIVYNSNKLKQNLDDLQAGGNVGQLLKQYANSAHKEVTTRYAENKVYDQAIANIRKNLAPYQQYYKEQNGIFSFNPTLLTAAMPDDMKNWIQDQIKNANDYKKKQKDNLDAIDQIRKEFNNRQKKYLDDYVNLENEVVEKLKEAYQKEIDDLQSKYDAMKEADDNYLESLEEAIQKERNLRNRQNQWDDLATKEKKLSLMRADTSGSRQLEIAKLEKEVEEDRQKLLDDTTDDIVNQLKEMYELQQESRDAEIEYMEAMLDNAALIKEANAIIAGWDSQEDAVAWFKTMTDLSKLSDAQLKKEEENWKDLFNAKDSYLESSKLNFDEYLKASTLEINNKLKTISETLSTESTRSLGEVKKKINDAETNAKEKLDSANKNLDKANEKLEELQKETEDLKKKLDEAKGSYNKTGEEAYKEAMRDAAMGYARMNGTVATDSNNTTTTPEPKYESRYDAKDHESRYGAITPERRAIEASYHEPDKTSSTSTTKKDIKAQMENIAVFIKGSLVEILKTIDEDEAYQFNSNNTPKEAEEDEKRLITYIDKNKISGEVIAQTLSKFGISGYYYPDIKTIKKTPYNDAYHASQEPPIKFAKGGLVNYTGPAWVDGSPSRPEAFLSVEDTSLIGNLIDILHDLPFLNSSGATQNISTSTVGDTNISLTVNLESVSEDYDAERIIDLVKEQIVDAANYAGSNVILNKR